MTDPIKLSTKRQNINQIICSTITSITKVFIVQPFDFLRYRIQSSFAKTHKINDVIKNMFTQEGGKVFLKGSSATAFGIFISSFSVFYFYQKGRDICFQSLAYFRNDRLCQDRRFILLEKDFNDPESSKKYYQSKLLKISLLSSLGGVFAGIFTTLMTLPTDNIRIRIQSTQNIKRIETKSYNFNKPRESVLDTYKRFGIKGFYVAGSVSMLRECVAGFFYFGLFEYLKNKRKISQLTIKNANNIEKINHLPIGYSFLYGSLSGALNWCITLPIDHVKTKMISDRILPESYQKFENSLDCVKKTYTQFGVKGFYSGFSIILLRATIVNGVVITVFDKCSKMQFGHY